MSRPRHSALTIIFILVAACSARTTPAMGQRGAPPQGSNLGASFLGASAGLGIGLVGAGILASGESNASVLAGVVMFGAIGYGAARGASTDDYSVGMLAPTAVAFGAGVASLVVAMGMAEGGGEAAVMVVVLGAPVVAAALTATALGNRQARALAHNIRPTVGGTPAGQLGLGLRVRLPNH